jgi:PDDEXK-like domain of unknown function (DUF3799)
MVAQLKFTKWSGGSIGVPGLYEDMKLETYHGRDVCDGISISSSGLRTIFNESPAHYWATSVYNRERIEEELSREMIIGRAMHHLMFGEPDFARLFRRAPAEVPDAKGVLVPWSRRTNYAKEWCDARKREGVIVIDPKEVEQIEGMARVLGQHEMVQAGAFDGYIERSGFWRDEETGVWLRIRPDVIPSDSGDFVDFKTTASVQWVSLQRVIADMGYIQQFALMREVFRKLKFPVASATLVFVERKPPHCVRVVSLRPEDLDDGEQQNRRALRTFVRCWQQWSKSRDARAWPGPGGDRRMAEEMFMADEYRKRVKARLATFAEEEQAA